MDEHDLAHTRPGTRHKTESVDMRSRRFGYFPRTFVWRGKEHTVSAVECCWTTGTRPAVLRHYFKVKCDTGAHLLYQDIQTGAWHIVTR